MRKTLKVAWFASAFVGRNASGTAQVARKIIEYILLNESKTISIVLIAKDNYEIDLIKKDEILSLSSVILLPEVKGKILKSSRQFYKYIFNSKKIEVDVLHFSVPRLYPFFWKFPSKKFFCTFHAGGDISLPHDKFVLSRTIYNCIAKLQWKQLDKIFAVSEFGKSEIESFYHIPKNRIDRIYPGADHLWNIEATEIKMNKSKLNILVVGRWQKYKNVHSILIAFSKLEDSLLENFHIFVVGRYNSTDSLKVQQFIQRFSPDNLTWYNYLSDAELKYLYQNANLVIHPSINEGFGLPAFEAFAEGAPIAVHKGLPADSLLSNQSQVYVIDMLNIDSIVTFLKDFMILKRVNTEERRKYLIENSMTWNQMCKNYVYAYLKT